MREIVSQAVADLIYISYRGMPLGERSSQGAHT